MNQVLEHNHIIIRAYVKNPPKDPEYVNLWLENLIHDIGMKILIYPQSVYSNVPCNRGLTAICAIETSHIALHVWDEPDPAIFQLDVYTCKALDTDVVLKSLEEFGLVDYDYIVITRDEDLCVVKSDLTRDEILKLGV